MLQISEDRDAIFKTKQQYERDESYEGAGVEARSENRRSYATVDTVLGVERKEDGLGLFANEEKCSVWEEMRPPHKLDGEDKFAYLTRIFVSPDYPYRRYRNRQKAKCMSDFTDLLDPGTW